MTSNAAMKRCSPLRKSKDSLKVSKVSDSPGKYTDSWPLAASLRQSPFVLVAFVVG